MSGPLVRRTRRTGRLPAAAGVVEARCLGPLELIIDGQPVDLATARPRVRSLLRLLLSDPGAAFHHEVIAEAFWPDAEPEVGARNLHAAVAALRRLVEPGVARGSFQLVVRDGAAYRFVIAPESRVDVLQFDAAVETARRARATGDASRAETAGARCSRCTGATCSRTRDRLRGSRSPASAADSRRSRRPSPWPVRASGVGSSMTPPACAPRACVSIDITTRCGGCSSASGSAPAIRVPRAAPARATTRSSSSWASPRTPEGPAERYRIALNSSSRMATGVLLGRSCRSRRA